MIATFFGTWGAFVTLGLVLLTISATTHRCPDVAVTFGLLTVIAACFSATLLGVL